MSSFTKPLKIIPVIEKGIYNKWELEESFVYYTEDGEYIIIPKGYRTDFASVPKMFWSIIPPWGRYGKAAVVHDYLCDIRDRPSEEVHRIFNEAMGVLGVPNPRKWVMYQAVKWFGPKF